MAYLLIATSYAKPVHADSTDPVQILDVKVELGTLKVNDTFLISATILNSSPYPIYLTSGSCTPAFSVVFDAHAKQVRPNVTCTTEAILQKVDPQSQVTISNANKPGIIYQAVEAGTANANITIPYAKNQTATDYSNIDYTASKSFQFFIHDSNETTQNIPANFPLSYAANMTMQGNLTHPALHPTPPSLASINVAFNKTTSSPIVITGTVYKIFSNFIVLKIQNPQDNLVLVSQLQPSSSGGFSLKFVPLAPLWSTQGNYAVTVSSGSQVLDSTTFYFNGTSYRPTPVPIAHNEALPLEQFKSGIKAEDVKCADGFTLVIKSDDGSPACVKLDSAYMLIKRGWAVSESVYPGGNPQFELDTNSTIIPGHLPRSSGLMLPYSESHRIVNYTGFDGVYNETLLYHGTQEDYVLRQGNTGTITFEIDAQATEMPGQSYPTPLPKSLNLTNYAIFYHEITSLEELAKYPGVTFNGNHDFTACSTGPGGGGACIGGPLNGQGPIEAYVTDHPGVNVLFEPPLEVLPIGTHTTSQVVTMTITADSDASKGTYLVELPSFGGHTLLITVGSQPYHE